MTESQPNPFPWVGKVLGDGAIEVLEGLGRGGQGAVYKVRIDPVQYLLSCVLTGQSDPNDLDLSIFDKSSNSEEQVEEARETLKKRLSSITKTGQFKMVRNLSAGDVSPYRRPVGGSKNINDIYCAMKIIHTKNKLGYIDEDKVNRFFREIEIMKQLDNIHIPDSLGDFQEDDYIYHLTEFIDANIKFDEIEKPVSQKLIVHVAEGVTDALVYAHKKIVHRDIKPANILMDHEDMIKVLDFGTAKFNEDMHVAHQGDMLMTATNTVLGTVHFFSPEQARGDKVGKASDIYSLGASLYYLASGEYPRNESGYLRNNPQSIMHNILHRKPEPLPDEFDPLLKKMIMRMIAVDPGKRPTAEQAHRMVYNFHTKVPIEEWDPEILNVLDKKNIEKDVTPTEQIDLITNEYVSTKQVKTWLKAGALAAAVLIIGIAVLFGYLRSERGKEAEKHTASLISALESNISGKTGSDILPMIQELETMQENLPGTQALKIRALCTQIRILDTLDRNLDLLDEAAESDEYRAGDSYLEKAAGMLVNEKGRIQDERLTGLYSKLETRFETSGTVFREKKTISAVGSILRAAEKDAQNGNYAIANNKLKEASDLFAEYSKKPEYKKYQSRIGRLTALLLSKASAIEDYKTAESILNEQFNLMYDPILVAVKERKGFKEDEIEKLRELLRRAEGKLEDAGRVVTEEKKKEAETKLKNHYSRIAHLYALNYELTSLKPVEKQYSGINDNLNGQIPVTEEDLRNLETEWEKTCDDLKRIRKSAGEEYQPLLERVEKIRDIEELSSRNSKVAAGLFKKAIEKGDLQNAALFLVLMHRAQRNETEDYIDAYNIERKLIEGDDPDLHRKAVEIYRKLGLEERAAFHLKKTPPPETK